MRQRTLVMSERKTVTIVVPVFNEEQVIEEFHERVSQIICDLPEYRWELIFVNDGSRDNSLMLMQRLAENDPSIGLINLSRNFGKEIAMTAGFDHSHGDAVVVIDADLQDPPELIKELLTEWHNGFDVVYARRAHRDGETWLKRSTASAFYRLMDRLSGPVRIPRDTGDYRLMSRRAVNALLQLREQHRFMKGLFVWVGFPSKAIEYRRDVRAAGFTKFNYWKLWNFALEGVTSFTLVPLKIATYVGFGVALFAVLNGIWIFVKTLIWGEVIQGYPTLIVTILFLGGVQLFFIGILGEYLGRIFDETKQRPLYFVERYHPARSVQEASQTPGMNATT